ncbi:MAG TPA: efflux RND transporter periplasmic adaptor subunit, partial [Kofleriaceae bacterium]|nr:efflux RND transporter periplasmic adaptor subunit [Kofleriaceae bacterium]
APSGDGFVGVLTARRTAVVAVEVDARIEEVLVRMGDRVAAGQPVARLDDRAVRQRLAGAAAEADAARAAERGAALDLDDARHKLSVEKNLHRDGIVSRESVRAARVAIGRAESALARAAATRRAAVAAAAELERQLATTALAAPIAGVVTDLAAREGEMLAPGTAVMRILDPSELRLRFAVPADRAREVALGARVEMALPDSGRTVRGVVEHLAPELEPPLRLVVAEAALAPGPAAPPGSTGKVHVTR